MVLVACAEDAPTGAVDALATGEDAAADVANTDVTDSTDVWVEADLWTPPDAVADVGCAPTCTSVLPVGIGASPCHL